MFKKAVAAERNFLNTAANSKKPADPVAQNLFKPISDIAGQIIELKEKTKNTKFPWHLAAVAEGVSVLSWVLVVRFTNQIRKIDFTNFRIFNQNHYRPLLLDHTLPKSEVALNSGPTRSSRNTRESKLLEF